METVTLQRTVSLSLSPLRAAITDVEPFMRAAGFDEVTVDGDEIHITNHVGLLTIELELRRIPDPDGVFAYEQVEGIFREMRTGYRLETVSDDRTTVTAGTDFALDRSIVGPLLDATVIKHQRRRELTAQFDYLEDRAPE
jgi:hypothetical protein